MHPSTCIRFKLVWLFTTTPGSIVRLIFSATVIVDTTRYGLLALVHVVFIFISELMVVWPKIWEKEMNNTMAGANLFIRNNFKIETLVSWKKCKLQFTNNRMLSQVISTGNMFSIKHPRLKFKSYWRKMQLRFGISVLYWCNLQLPFGILRLIEAKSSCILLF